MTNPLTVKTKSAKIEEYKNKIKQQIVTCLKSNRDSMPVE